MKKIKVFKNDVFFLQTDKKERNMGVIFQAENKKDSIMLSLIWAKDRLKNLGFLKDITCMKVSEFLVYSIEEDGTCNTGKSFPFFEWKYDNSISLEEYIKGEFNII